MKKSSKSFIGMDVHKESIDITLAELAGEVRRCGQTGGEKAALVKAVCPLPVRALFLRSKLGA